MGFGITLRIRGEYACFTRPEMKAERVSYDVITPSATRGILEAIYWKPAITWRIDRIHVDQIRRAGRSSTYLGSRMNSTRTPLRKTPTLWLLMLSFLLTPPGCMLTAT